MPVGHNWQTCKLKSNKCPCCGKPDKTFKHLVGCKPLVQNECTQLELPLHFTATVIKALKVTLERAAPPTTIEADPLREAIAVKETIGYYNMAI